MFPVPRPVRRKRTAGTPQANGRYAASERPVSPPPDRPAMLGAPPRRPARPLAAPPAGKRTVGP